ncbi:MAG: slipin family protein [Candidatus Aenigmarchaeota archaeon]|nr:slipin family protein [Candidatus Aenigmarchaeota archaeon]
MPFYEILALVIILIILASSMKIIREYERVVVFRLGRLLGAKGPGLFFIIPFVDKVLKVDLRTSVIDVTKQTVVTADNVTVDVDAVVYYRVGDPIKSIVQVEDYRTASTLLAQTTLRDVLGQVDLDKLLAKREELSKKIQGILDEATDPWGIKVSAVTLKDVVLPDNMQRAMAKQAEAERERRGRVIIAAGEFEASKKMSQAASLYAKNPAALKLREFQTLAEIAREKNVIVVPVNSDVGAIAGVTRALSRGMPSEEQRKKR